MGSPAGARPGKSISLDELIAINDEMIALIRAGIPLELGLKEVARDQPRALSEISDQLADRMQRGDSLAEALAAEGDRFPKVYRVLVEAGLRAGRLSAALESISNFANALSELRRRVTIALLYPLFVCGLAYGLFLVFVVEIAARMQTTYDVFRIPDNQLLQGLVSLGEAVGVWAWIPPLLVVLSIGWSRHAVGRHGLNVIGPVNPLFWIPGINRITANFRFANFADLLALMVENRVPLPDGVLLAAEATGDRAMTQSAQRLAESTRSGASLEATRDAIGGFPPFLRWLMARGERQGDLEDALRLAADMYRRRAVSQTEWFKIVFPMLAGIGIGGGATLLYALVLFLPLTEMLNQLPGN